MKIAVFCGSNVGASEVYRDGAAAFGRALAEQNVELIFGGSSKGLMKIVADAVLDNGGVAHGIITRSLVDKDQQYDRPWVQPASRAMQHCRTQSRQKSLEQVGPHPLWCLRSRDLIS
jgi:predicted Rossmann-fold nucleotide-binding protein